MVFLHALGQCLIRTSLSTITPRAELGFALATRLIADRGRRFSRRYLAALFWPEVDERTAAHSLSEALHKLRRRGLPIETDEAHAVWVPRDAAGIDVERIGDASPAELAERDLSVLPGFEPRGSAELRDWADEWRDELRARTVRGLRLVIAQAERDEDWPNAMLLAEQVLRLDHADPTALAARVRAADALRRQQTPAGISGDPDPQHDPGEGASARPAPAVREGVTQSPRLVCAVSAPRASTPSTPVVGRDAELAVLGDAWDRARHGHGGRVWVQGPSGIGKTRLITHMVSNARRSLGAAAEVACEPGDAQRPLSTFMRLVPRLRRLPGAAGCSPDATPFLDRLTEHDAANPLWPDAADAPHIAACVQQAIVDLADAVADEQPLLLAVDDVQWIDEDSARLLETLTLAAASRPLLVLMASCDACPAAAADCVSTIPLCLAPLDDDAAREHVAQCCTSSGPRPTAELVQWFVDAGEGNPLRLEELVNHWRTTGVQFELPPTLGALLQSRVTALGAPARRVLQMAAVLGRHSTLSRIERALGFADDLMLEALEELGRTAMVRVGPAPTSEEDTLTCRHGALAEAALAQMSAPALQLLHRRAALILESDGPAARSTDVLWDEAEHWHASGASERVAKALSCVAHLVDIGLVPGAVDACRHLVDTCDGTADRALALRSLASLLHLTQSWDELTAVIEQLRATHPSGAAHDDIELLALDAAWHDPSDWGRALDAALACVHASDAEPVHRVRAATLSLKLATNIGCVRTMHDVYAAVEPILGAESVSPRDRSVFEMIYHSIVGDAHFGAKKAYEALSTIDHSPGTRQLRLRLDCASSLGRTGSLDEAIGICADVSQRAAAYGMPGLNAQACHRAITILLNRGDTASVAQWIARYDAIEHPELNPARARAVRLARVRLAVGAGALEQANHEIGSDGEVLWEDPSPMFRTSALATKLALDMARELPPEVIAAQIERLETAGAPFRRMGAHDYETSVLAAALQYAGETAAARRLVHRYLNEDRRDPHPVPEGFAAIHHHARA